MTAAAGVWNNTASSANPLMSAKAMTSPSDTNTADAADATITANDFLTLLVTEMQNQDPTADVDPNEYIDQLVDVNSLEQLISINQTLSTALGTDTSSSDAKSSSQPGSSPTSAAAGTSAAQPNAQNSAHPSAAHAAHPAGGAAGANTIAAHQAVSDSAPVTKTHGNLGTPRARPSALRVARALDGQRITR